MRALQRSQVKEPLKTALDMAEFLDGMLRNPKMHPCGVVLSRPANIVGGVVTPRIRRFGMGHFRSLS